MNNSLFSNGSSSCLALFFLLSLQIGSAQDMPSAPTPQTPDSLIQSLTRQWPNVRLVEMEPEVAEALMIADLSEKIARLQRISRLMFPELMPDIARSIFTALQSKGGETFDGFKIAFCRLWPEYDCQYDFSPDALREAFTGGTDILNEIQRPRGPLYLLISGSTADPKIHSILGFDSAAGNFRVISYSYPYPLNDEGGYDLLHHFDSIANSYLPFPTPLPNEVPYLPLDSVRRWFSINNALKRKTGKEKKLSAADFFMLPDSLVEQFQREWSSLKLIAVDANVVRRWWEASASEDIERLREIGNIIAPAPLPDFEIIALSIVQSSLARSFDSFKLLLCKRYSEYSCDRDFDNDACQSAFSIAGTIAQRMRQRPSNLYFLTSRSNGMPEIYALLGFDPRSQELRIVNYGFNIDRTTKELFLHRYDSIALEVEMIYQQSRKQALAPIPTDSLEKWSQQSEKESKDTEPTQLSGYSFVWFRTKGEEKKEFNPIVMLGTRVEGSSLQTDPGIDTLGIHCEKCTSIGLAPPRITRTTRLSWTVTLEVNDSTLLENVLRSNNPINVEMKLIYSKPDIPLRGCGFINVSIVPDEPLGKK